MKEKLKAYEAVHAVAVENEDHLNPSLMYAIKEEYETAKRSVEFNLPLEYAGPTWYKVSNFYKDWVNVGLYGEETARTISWSDDKKQPDNEWLYVIRFSTGAYVFGDYLQGNYPKETFDAFFAELKSFEPKYCDTMNNSLYFTPENAHKVHNALWDIFNKYKALVVEENNRKRVASLEAELEKLKGMM